MNLYEAIGVAFGLISVWLMTRENVWAWPTGVVNVALSLVVFGQAKLYADMGLQVVYLVLCLYGWYHWLHGGEMRGELRVAKTPRSALAVLFALGAAGGAALGFGLAHHTDASLPFWDSGTTSFSLVAQWMQTRKWLENWIVWIAVDAVYIPIYLYKRLYLMAGLYAVFLALAAIGLRQWRGSLSASS